jgi:hypothetical protein
LAIFPSYKLGTWEGRSLSQASKDCRGICWDLLGSDTIMRQPLLLRPPLSRSLLLSSSSTLGRVWLDSSLLFYFTDSHLTDLHPTIENGAIPVEAAGAGHNREARRTAARHAARARKRLSHGPAGFRYVVRTWHCGANGYKRNHLWPTRRTSPSQQPKNGWRTCLPIPRLVPRRMYAAS